MLQSQISRHQPPTKGRYFYNYLSVSKRKNSSLSGTLEFLQWGNGIMWWCEISLLFFGPTV